MLQEFTYTNFVSRDSFILEFRGIKPDRTVHHYEMDCFSSKLRAVTWQQVFVKRTERQSVNLHLKRAASEEIRAGYIHVFYNDTDFFGGWWIYLHTIRNNWGINFRFETNWKLVEEIMERFPMGVIPNRAFFDEWAQLVAKKFPRKRTNDPRKAGILYCKVLIKDGRPVKIIEAL